MGFNINLENKYKNRKGIYVLTYNGKPPYKVGMTNGPIYKRLNSYVNCPSQHDGQYIHQLLTWSASRDDVDAKNVERFIHSRLPGRLNSTQRTNAYKTEHFNCSLKEIDKVFKEAKQYYEKKDNVTMYNDPLYEKTVKESFVSKSGKQNVTVDAKNKK